MYKSGDLITGTWTEYGETIDVIFFLIQLRPRNLYHLVNINGGATVWFHDEPKTLEEVHKFIEDNIKITNVRTLISAITPL